MKYEQEVQSIANRFGGVVPASALRLAGLPAYLPRLGMQQGWQRIWHGIYVPHSGPVTVDQWIAVGKIAFGQNTSRKQAALGGEAALYKMGVLEREPQVIDFWVESTLRYQRVAASPLRVRRDYLGRLDRIPDGYDHTGLVDSLCDYLNDTTDEIDAAGAVIRVRKRWPMAAQRLVDAFDERKKLAHRKLATMLLNVEPAFDSPLEWLWVKLVEEPHGIEAPIRQWRCPEGFIRDNGWPALKAIVELDGDAYHSDAQTIKRDRAKDRLSLVHGFVTLRFGYQDVVGQACQVAHELGQAVAGLRVRRCARALCAVPLRWARERDSA